MKGYIPAFLPVEAFTLVRPIVPADYSINASSTVRQKGFELGRNNAEASAAAKPPGYVPLRRTPAFF
jgi:hypothetical protein